MDCGRALAAYMEAKTGNCQGRRVGFPRYKRKGRRHDSFRLRNKKAEGGSFSIRVGEGSPRSVILPGIGTLRVHDDTRRLRRLLRPVEQLDPMIGEPVVSPRARILFATVRRHGSRWSAAWSGCGAVPVPCRAQSEALATGPRPPGGSPASMPVSPTCEELPSRGLHPARQTHSRLAIEDLAVADLIRDRHRSRAIGDAAWTEFDRRLRYKTAWLGGELVVCDRWFPSTRTCSGCTRVTDRMGLAERTFRCGCGLIMDRDRNAAANLAAWAEHAQARTAKRAAGVTNASGGEGAGRHRGVGKPPPTKEEPTLCARRS